ncbi:MAG: hypothetical protein EOP00_06200 [Pedobacter sp.]|nr:MAG: hypothetical protein EOP00_06200 [Pedobacter sp.]
MKRSFLFIVGILCLQISFAQVKPIYFIGDSITTDQTKATHYAVSGKLSGEDIYVLKMYDLYDNLIQTGFYKDEALAIPHGKFLMYASVNEFNHNHDTNFYFKEKDRFLAEQGSYADGKKIGRWVQFYPDGKIFQITNYIQDIKHGEFKTFNRRGKVMTSGNYKLDLKDGDWNYDNGKKETYVNGIVTFRNQN